MTGFPPLRPFRAADAPRLVAVVGAVFAEYGMRFDPDGYDRDVPHAAERYSGERAAMFVAEDAEGRAVGFAGVDLPRDGVAELHRLYIDPAARGLGLGRRLCEAAEAWARGKAAWAIQLWSDVRFAHAHGMYVARGYDLVGQRVLADLDRSVEFGFEAKIERLGAAPRPARLPVPPDLDWMAWSMASADTDLAHRARMVAAAIIDPRSLVRSGRVDGGGHVLIEPADVLGIAAPEAAILVLPGRIVIGLGRGEKRLLHPIFQPS